MNRESRHSLRNFTRLPFLAILMALGLAQAGTAKAESDAAISQAVWKMYYGVTDAQIADTAWLAADADGDGLSNGAELAAGTNPFNAKSNLAVGAASPDGVSTAITIPTAWGKLYRVQATTSLANTPSWIDVSPLVQIVGDGTAKTLTVSQSNTAVYYRVMALDQDSDGDGLSDWVEKITGFDPNNAHTHGATQDDHTALVADLVGENVVTITADKASATQPPDGLTAATDTGTLTITRGGTLHFSTVTVPLQWSGTAISGIDYALMPSSVTFLPKVGSITLTVTPLANPNRRSGATLTLKAQPGGGYAVGAPAGASVLIAPAGAANGTGLTGYYWNSTSTLVTKYAASLFSGTPAMTRPDLNVNFTWTGVSPGTGSTGTVVNPTYFVVRWAGQVQPQYSETYYFDTVTDDGVKLWVNGQLLIDGWTSTSAERINSITLKAGVLYDIRMEYYQYTGTSKAMLYWYSDSQTKQIIPTNRLYPDTTTMAPPAFTSASTAYGFVNQPFTFTVTASIPGGTPLTFAVGQNSGSLPPGLTLNASTGIISGTPTQAGDFQVALTATNAAGTGAAVLDLQVLSVGSGVTRELWTSGVTGTALADVPFNTTPSSIDTTLVTLEDNTNYPDKTGERLRGYFTAPVTGNYYFWLAANNAAELWVSNNAEPINLTRRAWVKAPGVGSQVWTDASQPNLRSPWLALVAGQSYYYEVLHNSGAGGGADNLAVGYSLDATGAMSVPASGNVQGGGPASAVVPGYVLSKYDYPQVASAAGTLYVTNLSPQGAATSTATGSADLRIIPGSTQAVLHFDYSGLTSPRTAYHIHMQDSSGSGPIVFDLDDVDKFHPELRTADGGYVWNIIDVGTLTTAQIISGLQAGNAYFNVHTVNYPGGEIRGNLGVVIGSQTPPASVPDPGYNPSENASDAGAARFLNQAAFGAHPSDVASVKSGGYAAWINNQFTLPKTSMYADVLAHVKLDPNNLYVSSINDNAWWRAAVTGSDQLRQRTAFALSEILVVSDTNSTLAGHAEGLGSYYDVLADGAFGNFRDLLKAITLHPVMGYYLNMQGNKKGNISSGLHPNENYGREIMQLFSVGLNRLWPDGSLVLDSKGGLVPTYTQDEITGMARVFTGWNWYQALQTNGRLPTGFSPSSNYVLPMTLVPTQHELGAKVLLDNVVLPPAVGYNLIGSPTAGTEADPSVVAFDTYCSNDLEKAIDNIFYHPNVGPYLCRQLIQRLVSSNPSPAYLNRVVQKFNDDGTAQHVRGNMQAVVKTILLDGEARNLGLALASTTGGKQREPLMRMAGPARTFPYAGNSGTFGETGALAMTITTSTPHRLIANDAVFLDFTGNATGSPAVAPANNPHSGAYSVLSTPAPTATTFAVNATSLSSVAYTQAAGSTTLTVTASGIPVGDSVYLKFLTGGAPDGLYPVATLPDSSHFTVTTTDTPTAVRSGTVFIPKVSGYYNLTKNSTALAVIANTNANVQAGDAVMLVVPTGVGALLSDLQATVTSVQDEHHFTITLATTPTATDYGRSITIYPLIPPPITRSGSVAIAPSRFDMGNTNGSLTQTPLNAPTVFNYFLPDYKYPGNLAAGNVTTPEFQLTTDSNIVTLTNTLNSTILSSSNTAGLSNFVSGALMLDLGAFMGAPYASSSTVGTTTTTTVDATALVNKLGDLLTGGTLTQDTKNTITTFLNNTTYFPTTSTTTARDKVRAVVQLILASPEYAVQR